MLLYKKKKKNAHVPLLNVYLYAPREKQRFPFILNFKLNVYRTQETMDEEKKFAPFLITEKVTIREKKV